VTHNWVCIAQLCAAAKAGRTTTVLPLLKQGTPPDKKDVRSTTPLWPAASNGHTDIVQVLLATNAVDVNAESDAQRTPILWAATDGHVEIVKLLLAHGARQDYTDEDGQSPLAIDSFTSNTLWQMSLPITLRQTPLPRVMGFENKKMYAR
jgi:ankyrin repeat protein